MISVTCRTLTMFVHNVPSLFRVDMARPLDDSAKEEVVTPSADVCVAVAVTRCSFSRLIPESGNEHRLRRGVS